MLYITLSITFISLVFLFAYFRHQTLASIEQANQIVLSMNSSSSNLTESELTKKKKEIDKVIFWLQRTPNLLQMPYQNAQNKLQEIQIIATEIEQKVKNNKIAKDALQSSKNSVSNLGTINFSSPKKLSYWQNAKDVLTQAIQSLQNIPNDISQDIQTQIKDSLTDYNSQYSQVNSSFEQEKQASESLTKAENLKQQASDVLNNTKPSITALKNAQSQINEAISLLKNIPSTTTVASNAQGKISDYEQKLNSIASPLKEAIRNACPYTYQYFQNAIGKIASQDYMSFGDVSEGEFALEKITRAYEEPKCEDVRSQVRNSLLSAWENHYNKEFNQANNMATLGAINFCQPMDYGCEQRSRDAEIEKQQKLRQLNEERREKIKTIQSRLSM